jgi:hypothetical protein
LLEKCDCGFGTDRGVLRDVLDEPLNLAVHLLALCRSRGLARNNGVQRPIRRS